MIAVSLCVCMLSLSSCSKEVAVESDANTTSSVQASESTNQTEDTVEVTIAASWFEDGFSQADVDQIVNDTDGYISGTLNDDGSVTYVMTREKYDEQVTTVTESLEQSYIDIVESGDYPNISNISHNEDFTEYIVDYNADEMALGDGLLSWQFFVDAGLLCTFTGRTVDDVHVMFVNPETGEVLYETHSSDLSVDSDSSDEEMTVEE